MEMAAADTAGKELKMRMNKKNHTTASKRPTQKKKGGSEKNIAKNSFRQNPFVNLKEEFDGASGNDQRENHMSKEDTKHMAELIGSMLEEVFGGDMECCAGPVIGVIDLDPECMLNMEFKKREAGLERKNDNDIPAMPPCDGCGEEVFQEMLGDLNYMAKMILEADFLTKLMCEEKVDPEDARCITYLSVHEARDILKKWDAYRRCEL